MFVISPEDMSLLPEFKEELDLKCANYREEERVEKVIADADVIYMEPVVQAHSPKGGDERAGELPTTPAAYKVTRELLRDRGKTNAIVLHSLPRMDELRGARAPPP